MATDPNEHPTHRVPETFPLPPSRKRPTRPPQPQLPQTRPDYADEVEDEDADPVGQPPRM